MFRKLFRCPDCRHDLIDKDNLLVCANCLAEFPIVNNIPILLPSHSVFSIQQVAATKNTFFADKVGDNSIKSRLRRILPKLTSNRDQDAFNQRMKELIDSLPAPVTGLQIGSGENPESIESVLSNVEWLHSDVDISYQPHIIADATGLPIADNSIDVVYADRVLQHVFNIHQAAQEIQRVLKVGGLLIIGIPFTHPFHGVPYDFYRVTPSGIRAMFPQTESLSLDTGSGAWSALALQLDARLVNLFEQRQARWAASTISRLLFSGLKYLDGIADKKRNMISCVSLTYIGRKVSHEFTPREIMDELRCTFV